MRVASLGADAELVARFLQSPTGAGEHADAARVDERDVVEIDHDLTAERLEHAAQFVADREVELTARGDDRRRTLEGNRELCEGAVGVHGTGTIPPRTFLRGARYDPIGSANGIASVDSRCITVLHSRHPSGVRRYSSW